MCVYAGILVWANRSAALPADHPLAVLVVAYSMLVMNTVHFLDRPGYADAATKAKTKLQGIRCLELLIFIASFGFSLHRAFAATDIRCGSDQSDGDAGDWFFRERKIYLFQLVAAIFIHFVIIFCHPTINRLLFRTPNRQMVRFGSEANGEALQLNPSMGLSQVMVVLGGAVVASAMLRVEELQDANDFVALRKLGSGSYGVVLLMVEVVREGRPVPEHERRQFAMKVLSKKPTKGGRLPGLRLPADLAEAERDIYRRIWKEQEQLDAGMYRCGHPCIVRLYFFCRWEAGRQFTLPTMEVGTEVGTQVVTDTHGGKEFHLGLMMEYCPRGSLEDYAIRYLNRNSRKPDFEWFVLLRRFLAEVLLALDYLHRIKNVVYRDLKLDNVLVVNGEGGPHVKIGDFGFSKAIGMTTTEATSLAGTPYWAAPEMIRQAHGGRRLHLDTAAHKSLDVYSFGTLAFALSYGYPYLPDPEEGHKKGNPASHPRCAGPPCNCYTGAGATAQTARVAQSAELNSPIAQRCEGCSTLSTLEKRFPTFLGNASITDLVKKCVSVRSFERPTTEHLRNHALFTQAFDDELSGADRCVDPAIDFTKLLRMEQSTDLRGCEP